MSRAISHSHEKISRLPFGYYAVEWMEGLNKVVLVRDAHGWARTPEHVMNTNEFIKFVKGGTVYPLEKTGTIVRATETEE